MALLVPLSAEAVPQFARKEGRDCTTCHVAYPKLNETGHIYKMNGYRFPGTKGTNIWEQKFVPLSMVAEIEAFIDQTKPISGKNNTVGPDAKIDEIEIMGAGTLGDRVAFFAELEFEGSPGFGDIDVGMGPVWGQLNDLYGPQGALNARVGQFDVDLPFFAQGRRVVRNGYLMFDKLGYLDTQFGLELNGQLLSDEEEGGHTHRYGAGVIRTDVKGDNNKFTRGYGWYSKTIDDRTHIGTMVMGGRDNDGTRNFETVGVLVAGQTECDHWILTAAYAFDFQDFRMSAGGNMKFHNALVEALWLPTDRWVFGGRIDWLIETERRRKKDWGLRGSVLGRYNVVANVWLGAEYRIEDGGTDSPVTAADTTHKGRLFAFLAF